MLDHQLNTESFEKLDSSIQTHYEKQGDDYFLQAKGMSPKSKVDEFRNANIELKKTSETYQTTITDLQGKLQTANEGHDEDKVKALVDEGVKKRVIDLNKEHETALNDATNGRTKAESALNKLVVSDAVQREAIGSGVKDTAIEDVLMRANQSFRVVNGIATAYNGEEQLYGKDGVTPLSVKDWLAGQAISAPHLFKESKGSGAENKDKDSGAATKTWTRAEFDTKNPAERSKFFASGGKLTD